MDIKFEQHKNATDIYLLTCKSIEYTTDPVPQKGCQRTIGMILIKLTAEKYDLEEYTPNYQQWLSVRCRYRISLANLYVLDF